MLTWLDRHLRGSSALLRQMVESFPDKDIARVDPEMHRRLTTDDALAFRLFIEAALFTLEKEEQADPESKMSNAALEIAAWQRSLAPFFVEVEQEPLAAALDRDVVEQLAGTRLSPEVRNCAVAALSDHKVIYLDIADRALLLGENFQLCALFIAEAKKGIRFWAVFGEPGRAGNRRIAWIEGGETLLMDQYHDEGVRHLQGYGGTPAAPLPPLDEVVQNAGVDLDAVLKGLEDFAYLATTYVLTEMRYADDEAWQVLPHLPAGHERRLGRRRAQVAKRFSLFRVWRVTARNLDRGERELKGCRRWRLGHRISVSGHYRLQPCGPGRTQRRLRWIAPHGRGPGPLDGLPPRHIVRTGPRFRRRRR